MPAPCSSPSPSVLGLVLTLDPASSGLTDTLRTLRTRRGLMMEEPHLPFAAVALESTDPRGDHAWLEALPGVTAVDVVFVEIAAETAGGSSGSRPRRRSRDPLDDAPQPAQPRASEIDPDFPASLPLPETLPPAS